MSLLDWLLGQCRQPRGWFGRHLARRMNSAHSPMTDWVLSLIDLQGAHSLLDIGCGGGAALKKLSELAPEASLHGIDYSDDCLAIAGRTNEHLLAEGRLTLQRANVARLPFEDDSFDLAVTIESHFFWPDLTASLAEVRRVLKAGGRLAIASGVCFGGKHEKRNRRLASKDRMNSQTLPELEAILLEAGYDDIHVHEKWKKSWACLIGRKPRVSE